MDGILAVPGNIKTVKIMSVTTSNSAVSLASAFQEPPQIACGANYRHTLESQVFVLLMFKLLFFWKISFILFHNKSLLVRHQKTHTQKKRLNNNNNKKKHRGIVMHGRWASTGLESLCNSLMYDNIKKLTMSRTS